MDHSVTTSSSNGVITHGALLSLIQGFAGSPAASGRAVREFADRAPQRFADAACLVLREAVPEAGRNFLLGILMERDVFLKVLPDPKIFVREKALELAQVVHRTYPNVESQLLRQALQDVMGPGAKPSEDADWEKLHRVLDILGHMGHSTRVMPILTNLLRSSTANIRARLAPMIICSIRNPQWMRELASDVDAQVRANAVESFLTVDPLAEEVELLHKLAADSNHRVATTTLVVLSRHGDRDLAEARLLEFCHHKDPAFRAATAWAMGKTGNPRFLPELQRMVREEQGDVKRMAFLSCVSLRKEQATAAASSNEAA
ncbi:MAG: HEAT repeat domain-containing protein [Bryobacterales bacterium]|nr:HEAT repeat domain-containing protein [Bryobacterales bacterium]